MQNTADWEIHRTHILATGQVQGVGFRPFVYRLAHLHNLGGFVGNTSQGVCIEVQGKEQNVLNFIHQLKHELPPLASLTSLEVKNISPKCHNKFMIIESQGEGGHSVLISADTSICSECEQDILDKSNHRYNYPFTNCTNCGPRYTITHSIPYDRATTSMACFSLCPQCHAEYEDPLNRRFHAQPNACPICGPKIWCVEQNTKPEKSNYDNAPQNLQGDAALKAIAEHLKAGKLAAIKGLGGFHLSCDANNEASVALLRERKNRPHKPLALMVANLQMAKAIAHITPEHEALLNSGEKPIVLCKKRDSSLPQLIAPDADSIGIVLPYTPLHIVLFKHFAKLCGPNDIAALVMTSGNAGGEPICLGNREALNRLAHIADIFLLHNRDILVRTDDSVCKIPDNTTINHSANDDKSKTQLRNTLLRRARGYVPRPITLPCLPLETPPILGMGAELKSTICLSRGQMAFLSQHIGDLQNVETLGFYNEVIKHLEMLLEVQAKAIVHDLHPNFMSTQMAKDLAKARGIPCFALQHHFAHAWSVLAEHDFQGKALALTLDGTGLGLDNTIWGGELLHIDTQSLEQYRVGSLSPFALAGGDAATKEPWRIALALAKGTPFEASMLNKHDKLGPAVLEMLNRQINCPQSSSVGRLFDAVAAGLGLCTHTSYEGQAAIRLEYAQSNAVWNNELNADCICPAVKIGDLWQLPSQDLFAACLAHFEKTNDVASASRHFHVNLAKGFVHMASLAAKELDTKTIALSGGAMQNGVLQEILPYLLQKEGFTVLMHINVPSNDGGLALGQVAWGARMMGLNSNFT